ncbi:MAG TPA: HyaD/HybD family hydrogenase maturation endopeptidase [Geobacteraceae bacterium]|nr:HyaD/HybD family hydrogenase maturation endopeptidase [Geobacteraceae bacterium]
MRGGGNAPPRNVLILGVGNLLLTDDGFGVHCINAMREIQFPPNVTVMESGTVGHQLVPTLNEIDLLIVVDAIEAGDTPGSIFRFTPEDLQFKSGIKSSLHQLSLIDVLQMAEMTGSRPETIIIAVQPRDVKSCSMELNEEVKAVIPRVIELVLEELKKRGMC